MTGTALRPNPASCAVVVGAGGALGKEMALEQPELSLRERAVRLGLRNKARNASK